MPQFSFTENTDDVVEKTIVQIMELASKTSGYSRNIYGQNSQYTIAIDQQFGGFQRPVLFSEEIISASQNPEAKPLVDNFKGRLKKAFNDYIWGDVIIHHRQEYTVDFNVPQINKTPELDFGGKPKTIVWPKDYFDKDYMAPSAKMITIKLNEKTREVEDEENVKAELSQTIDEFVDAAFEYNIEFYKTIKKAVSKLELTN